MSIHGGVGGTKGVVGQLTPTHGAVGTSSRGKSVGVGFDKPEPIARINSNACCFFSILMYITALENTQY